jgi:hypothetical protein
MCGSAKSLKDYQVYSHLWEFEVSRRPTILEQGSNFVEIGFFKKLLESLEEQIFKMRSHSQFENLK